MGLGEWKKQSKSLVCSQYAVVIKSKLHFCQRPNCGALSGKAAKTELTRGSRYTHYTWRPTRKTAPWSQPELLGLGTWAFAGIFSAQALNKQTNEKTPLSPPLSKLTQAGEGNPYSYTTGNHLHELEMHLRDDCRPRFSGLGIHAFYELESTYSVGCINA